MGMIMKALTYDYGGAEPLFHLLGRGTLSEHDKLYIKESPPHCEELSLKLRSTKEIISWK